MAALTPSEINQRLDTLLSYKDDFHILAEQIRINKRLDQLGAL